MVGGEIDYFVEVNGMVIAEQGTSVSVSGVLTVWLFRCLVEKLGLP
jgi:hypothetical protein